MYGTACARILILHTLAKLTLNIADMAVDDDDSEEFNDRIDETTPVQTASRRRSARWSDALPLRSSESEASMNTPCRHSSFARNLHNEFDDESSDSDGDDDEDELIARSRFASQRRVAWLCAR